MEKIITKSKCDAALHKLGANFSNNNDLEYKKKKILSPQSSFIQEKRCIPHCSWDEDFLCQFFSCKNANACKCCVDAME